MEIIYIITYKCNLRCTYCPIKKNNSSISNGVIKDSFKLLDNKINKVRFFGGEPLLEYEKLKYLVAKIRQAPPEIKFFLTTNGILLDKKKINWIKKNKIKLTISLDGNEFTQLKNRKGLNSYKKISGLLKNLPKETIFNLVIAPNTAKYFYYNFRYLIEQIGVNRFNILPAYYNNWSAVEFKILEKEFLLVLNYIESNSLKDKIFLKNLENFSDLTFFNQALVIDCDGQIYNTNAFLFDRLAVVKKYFKIGDLEKINTIKELEDKKTDRFGINKFIPNRDIQINNKLDKILNNFIYKYKGII